MSPENQTSTSIFKPIFSIQNPKVAMQAMELSAELSQAVVVVHENGNSYPKFDVDKALKIIHKADQSLDPTKEIGIVTTNHQEIQEASANVGYMTEQVIKTLINNGIEISDKLAETYRNAIKNAFTNLASQQSGTWIFWQRNEAHKTTYQYNLLFAIQNEHTGLFLKALALGLTITVDLDHESVLGITIEDKHTYEVIVDFLELAQMIDTKN